MLLTVEWPRKSVTLFEMWTSLPSLVQTRKNPGTASIGLSSSSTSPLNRTVKLNISQYFPSCTWANKLWEKYLALRAQWMVISVFLASKALFRGIYTLFRNINKLFRGIYTLFRNSNTLYIQKINTLFQNNVNTSFKF